MNATAGQRGARLAAIRLAIGGHPAREGDLDWLEPSVPAERSYKSSRVQKELEPTGHRGLIAYVRS